jgi:multiple sugar transport system permease protein/putative aldouronate transport system permease protein
MEMNYFKNSVIDRLLMGFIYFCLFLFFISVAYPLIFVVSSSFSSVRAVQSGQVWLLPVDIDLRAYQAIFDYKQVWAGYLNSIIYTASGTFLALFFCILAAYPLSRKDFGPRNFFMGLFTFTMFFNGGLIPTYLLVKNLGLVNSRLSIILPGALNVWNVILIRTYFIQSLPDSILEASKIDGCNDITYLVRIALPLSKPIIAVIALFSAVGLWGSYFSALLYISSQDKYPLQIILRNILILNQMDSSGFARMTEAEMLAKQGMADLMKYALIVVSSVPMLLIYPFVQKHFVKGIMIGSIKG